MNYFQEFDRFSSSCYLHTVRGPGMAKLEKNYVDTVEQAGLSGTELFLRRCDVRVGLG